MFKYNSNFTTEIEVNKYGEIIKKENKERSKFDYIISNPPYQVQKGGTTNIDIWPTFINKACKLSDNVTMIHPGRWVNPKKAMEKKRDMIINNGLYFFNWYMDCGDIFSGTCITGGITVTCFRKGYKDEIHYSVDETNIDKIYTAGELVKADAFMEEAYSKVWDGSEYFDIEHRVKGNRGVSSPEFGYDKPAHKDFLSKSPEGMTNPIKIWANVKGKGDHREWWYIEKDKLNHIPEEILKTRKVMITKVGYNPNFEGESHSVIKVPLTQICEANSTADGMFFILPEIDDDYHLELIKSFFTTKTVRFLMYITQGFDIVVRGFENVPDYTYFIEELNGELFTDEFFYNKFNFSEELINHIEKVIKAK